MTDPGKGKQHRSVDYGIGAYLAAIAVLELSLAVFLAFLMSVFLKRFVGLRMWSEVLILLGTSLAIAVAYAHTIAMTIIKPVKKLRMAMMQISEGNYDVRIDEKSSIREVKQLYNSFNLMTRELQSTEIIQTDFVESVSHEIKTPAAAIKGYAEILRYNDPDETEREEIVDRLILNSDRLSQLVSDVLLLSKSENSSQRKKCVSYRLDEQIRQALLMFENEWEKKNLDFDVELDEIEYYGDEVMLMHVWMNLISNAVKFSYENGRIGIYLHKSDSVISFIIEDNGPGLPEGSERHIFNKFYQGDSSHKGEGNGLGLALVKNILENNNGSVAAENIEQGGARFIVTLKTE